MGIVSRCSGQGRRVTYHISNVKSRNSETLKVLVAHGANLEARDILGQTVVMDAFRYSSFDNVKYLLNNGANPNPINKRGVSLVEMVSKEIKQQRRREYNDECLTIKK